MVQGKKLDTNEEVVAATEAYFKHQDKWFYKHGNERLEKRWNDCKSLEGEYLVDYKFSEINVNFLVSPETY